jgi:multiple sugar transport system permease protein
MDIDKKSKIIFLGPAVFSIVLIFLYPVIKTSCMSLFYLKSVGTPISLWKFAGIQNYISLFNAKLFITSLANIGKIWFFCGLFTLGIGLLLSLILTSNIIGQKFFRAVIYIPNIIAEIAVGYLWLLYVYNSKFGLMKTIIEFLGIESLIDYQWLSTNHIFSSMGIAYIFCNVGFYMLMYIAGLEKIPHDYYSAASIEGAGPITCFVKITIPLIKNVISSSIVLWTTKTMGFFALSQVFGGLSTYTPMLFTYEALFGSEISTDSVSAGLAAASAVVVTLIVVTIASLTKKLTESEEYII